MVWCWRSGLLCCLLFSNNRNIIVSVACGPHQLEWVFWCDDSTTGTKYGFGFVSSGGLSVFRSVTSIWSPVRWVYTVLVECNGGGILRRKPSNDGIVGLRLLLVPSVVSFTRPTLGLELGFLALVRDGVSVGSCRSRCNQGLRAPFSR